MPLDHPSRSFGLDLVRAVEGAAIAAGRWMGLGNRGEADDAATRAMAEEFAHIDISGTIVIGEQREWASLPLSAGQTVGTGSGPELDVVVDPIDGSNLLAQGRPGAISVAGIASRGTMWASQSARYMEKFVVDRHVAKALVSDCLDAPAAWTLALVARVKKKPVRDLVVFVLDRPRHQDLIEEIRSAGARVMLRIDGDISGALLAASTEHPYVDVLMGIGGVSEGVVAACAVRALGGAMLARLAPQSNVEREAIRAEGVEVDRILTGSQLVADNQVFFVATGITDGPLLNGVSYHGTEVRTETIVLRGETGTRRIIRAEHTVPIKATE